MSMRAAAALATLAPLAGPRPAHRVALAGGSFTLIDESYNANPASMRAAFAVLGSTQPEAAAGASPCSATCSSSARNRRAFMPA